MYNTNVVLNVGAHCIIWVQSTNLSTTVLHVPLPSSLYYLFTTLSMLLAKMNKEPATTPHQRGQPALATPNRALTSAPNQKQRPSPQPVTPAAHNKHKTTVSTPAAPPKQNSVTPQTISSSPKATKSELQNQKTSEQYLFHLLCCRAE